MQLSNEYTLHRHRAIGNTLECLSHISCIHAWWVVSRIGVEVHQCAERQPPSQGLNPLSGVTDLLSGVTDKYNDNIWDSSNQYKVSSLVSQGTHINT